MSVSESKTCYDRVIETVVLLLMATGTVFVFSAGATLSGDFDLGQFYNFTTLKQLIFFPLAVFVMYAVSRVDYRCFSIAQRPPGYSLTPYLSILTLVLLIVVLTSLGVERNYSRRWLDLAPGAMYISFQPSELAKWVMILFLAAYLERYSVDRFWSRFIPVCLMAGLVVGLIVIEDFGTAAFIAMMSFIMLSLGGAKWWYLLSPIPVVLPAFAYAIISSPTRINRIKNFLDPGNMAYQARQSLIAISTGGLLGKGLGRGVVKYGHLPEDTTDFIFSIIAEEMGLAACGFVILLFIIFAVAGVAIAIRCRDRFGRLVAAGIVMAITIQAAVNIGVVTVVLPTKGIPLPFISAGGTSMLLTSAAVGVLLNIARQENQPQFIIGERIK
ncbi:MAG: stage V sporulation protein E [Planctomycetota bacterium]|nr:MAG: stage V sporulation protein E [Planctomycetota bacterium]